MQGFVLMAAALGATAGAPAATLADLSLEELGQIEVTSVSGRSERLSEAPASIYVITAEALRRSGATSLPQALRLAPNLVVAQVDAAQYAISARGFNNAIGNKLLVLIDGRTVYTPFFSGVFWDQQDLMLDDVERIEVISGPGATLWGANAVNGVINVITRPAGETVGTLVAGDAGDRERGLAVRHGLALAASTHLRFYAKQSRWDATRGQNGARVGDAGRRGQAGFRLDHGAARDRIVVQGDVYDGHAGTRGSVAAPIAPIDYFGFNLLARWTRALGEGSQLALQAIFDRSRRNDAFLYRPEVDVADIDLRHGVTVGAHKLLWGGGVRRAHDRIEPGLLFGFRPARRTLDWWSLFLQDEWQLGRGVELSGGVKLERNDYTGVETLPSARLTWNPRPGQVVWAALSRAVRAPARLDRDITLPPNPPFIIAGGPTFDSEVADVAELGWRGHFGASWSGSVTIFQHRWDRLRSGAPPPNAQVLNQIEGRTEGVEGWATWHPSPRWRLAAGLATLRKRLTLEAGSRDPEGPRALGNDPRRQASLRATFVPADGHELEIGVRHVGALPDPAVPAYTAADVRYAWRVTPAVSVAAVVRNAGDPAHVEFGSGLGRSEIEREALLQLRVAW